MTRVDALYDELASALYAISNTHAALAACYQPDTDGHSDHASSARSALRSADYHDRQRLRLARDLLPQAPPPAPRRTLP